MSDVRKIKIVSCISFLLTFSFMVNAVGAVTFTDDPIMPDVTVVRPVHIQELRDAINNLRSLNGLAPAQYVDPVLSKGNKIQLEHIQDLRDALNELYDFLRQERPLYTDPILIKGQTIIRADHINQLRTAVRAMEAMRVPLMGIWYSTWYTIEANYIWTTGHGVGSNEQLMGDVNGDGRADAIVYFANTGSWYVALSNGNGFDGYNQWITGHGVGSTNQLMGDVNGDGRDDAIVYFENFGGEHGNWYVALSEGNRFGGDTGSPWIRGHGWNSNNQLLGDVNGDGSDDAIVYFENFGVDHGYWFVALSTGSQFEYDSQNPWAAGYGWGSQKQLMGDVNGDHHADAIAFFDTGSLQGNWYVGLSTGSSFQQSTLWREGHGYGSEEQLTGDADGDGDDDAIVYFHDGTWHQARSNRQGFETPFLWKADHGREYYTTETPENCRYSGHQFLADTDRDIATDPTAFFACDGSWKIMPATEFVSPAEVNLWEAWGIKYRPYQLGQYGIYDSGDPAVIQEHLGMLEDANINFMLFDLTNGVGTGFIFERAQAVCKEIKTWNESGAHPIRYAIAVGQIQWTHDPATVESEAQFVWDQFVTNPDCGGSSNSFHMDGKPLLVLYAEYNDRRAWEDWNGDKSASNRFTVRFIQGTVPNRSNPNNPTPPSEDYGLYAGWGYPEGSLVNNDMMVVMPGWNNHAGRYVSRNPNGIPGSFYTDQCWERVTATEPKITVINSFNEYTEQTAVAPADTSQVIYTTEPWPSPSFYWDLTVNYINELRN